MALSGLRGGSLNADRPRDEGYAILQPERAATTRDRLLRAFPDISLVNLAQLRLSRLFQEYEGDGGDAKAAAGPALLFFSNVLPANPGAITVINMPDRGLPEHRYL